MGDAAHVAENRTQITGSPGWNGKKGAIVHTEWNHQKV